VKNFFIILLMFVTIISFSQSKDKQKSLYIEKDSRAISYVGVSRIQEDEKNGLNLGGGFIWYLGDDLFTAFNIDYSLFFYSFGNNRASSSLTNLTLEGILELHNDTKSSIEVFLGLGFNIVNIIGIDNFRDVITLGARYNYEKISFGLRYNLIGLTETSVLQTFSLNFGFLFDFRPKVLNKGYYSDEF